MNVTEQICKIYCLCPVCIKYSECKRCEKKCDSTQMCPKIACMSFKQKKGTKL